MLRKAGGDAMKREQLRKQKGHTGTDNPAKRKKVVTQSGISIFMAMFLTTCKPSDPDQNKTITNHNY